MPVANKEALVAFRSSRTRKALYRHTAEEVEGMRLSEWLRSLADRRVAELARRSIELAPAVNEPPAADSE